MLLFHFQQTFNFFQRFGTLPETDGIDNEAIDEYGGEGGEAEDPRDLDLQMMELDVLAPSVANESSFGEIQKGRGIHHAKTASSPGDMEDDHKLTEGVALNVNPLPAHAGQRVSDAPDEYNVTEQRMSTTRIVGILNNI